jgi:hypothetical protein
MSNEIEKYDDMVRKYGLSHNIATNKSKGIWANQIPSDHLFQTYEQFVCKRLANQTFGIKWPELEDWGPKECRKFYNERLMEGTVLPTQYHLNQSDNAIATTLAGTTPETREVLAYRWNNGYAFKNYRNRVLHGIESVQNTIGNEAGAVIKRLMEAEKDMDLVRGELDTENGAISEAKLSSRAKHLIEYMRANLSITDFLDDIETNED